MANDEITQLKEELQELKMTPVNKLELMREYVHVHVWASLAAQPYPVSEGLPEYVWASFTLYVTVTIIVNN